MKAVTRVLLGLTLALFTHTSRSALQQTPSMLGYQGRVIAAESSFSGPGQFKFALVHRTSSTSRTATATATVTDGFLTAIGVIDGGLGYTTPPAVTITDSAGSGAQAVATLLNGSVETISVINAGSNYSPWPVVTIGPPPEGTVYQTDWSNDQTSEAGSEPSTAVTIPVMDGLFSVLLGDPRLTNMTPLAVSSFTDGEVELRVWFDDGVHGFARLHPDQPLASVGYAMVAGSLTGEAVQNLVLPDNSIQTEHLAPNSVTGSKLGIRAVQGYHIALDAVTGAKITDDTVTGADIKDRSLTGVDLEPGSVTGSEIQEGSISGSHIQPGAITGSNISSNTITSAHVRDLDWNKITNRPPDTVQSGVIDLGSSGTDNYAYSFGSLMARLLIPFPQQFRSPPVVTLALATPALGFASSSLVVSDVTTKDFVLLVSLHRPAPILIDSGNEVGRDVCMQIVEGRPAVAYKDRTKGRILYKRAEDPGGVVWGAPVIVATQLFQSRTYLAMQVIDGKPAIAYRDGFVTPHEIRYVAALDTTGTVWAESSLVAAGTHLGEGIALIETVEHAGITYKDASGPLWFQRALNPTGSVWTAAVRIDGGDGRHFAGRDISMAKSAGGGLLISYSMLDSSTDERELRFVDGSEDGASWSIPRTVDSREVRTGFGCSVALIGGIPAISYIAEVDPGNSEKLVYVRAEDERGASWGLPWTVWEHSGALALSPTETSLAVVGGNPAIAFSETTQLGCMYLRSLDSIGKQWGPPIVLDDSRATGEYKTVLEVDGSPAVAYSSFSDDSLRYIRSGSTLRINWTAVEP